MFNIKRNRQPLLVIVDDVRWDAFGDLTRRSFYLHQVLHNMGGVNESVPPGRYHFDSKRRGLFKIEYSLLPEPTEAS